MKKALLLIVCIATISTTKSFAQLNYNLSDTAYINMANSNIPERARIEISNNSTTTATFEWRIIDYYIPTAWSDGILSDWEFSVPVQDTSWHHPDILTGDTMILDFQVKRNPGAGPGCAVAKIEYREQGQSSTHSTNLIITSFTSPSSCAPLAVNQFEKEKMMELFPNPASKELNIIIKTKNAALVNIMSIDGKQLAQQKIANSNAIIDISEYPSGIYFAEIKDRQGATLGTSKFVKH